MTSCNDQARCHLISKKTFLAVFQLCSFLVPLLWHMSPQSAHSGGKIRPIKGNEEVKFLNISSDRGLLPVEVKNNSTKFGKSPCRKVP
jgi:hypothetical protein